jgi:cytoskeletal protein CcmA (bactofilin family)
MSSKTPYIQHYPSQTTEARPNMTNEFPSDAPTETGIPRSVDVPVGAALPSASAHQLPTLKMQAAAEVSRVGDADSQSLIAEGVNFVGNAQLKGVCSVGGRVEGNLVQSTGHSITVIVTESGYVKGDIVASTISIMGQTDGLLDATGGNVTLHDASRVSGHVRYNRLQVNGADLNATLEKAAGPAQQGTGSTTQFGSGQ